MKRYLFFSLMGLMAFVSALSLAQKDNQPAILPNYDLFDDLPAEIPSTVRHPVMMWRAEKDGHTVHLIGSIHMASQDIYPLPGVMTEVFAEAGVILFEVNPNDMNETSRKNFYEAGQLEYGKSLFDLISPEVRKKLDKALIRNFIPSDSVKTLKPWLAAILITLSEMMHNKNQSLSVELGIDQYFTRMAKENGKAIQGLESPQDQMALLSSLNDQLSEEFLEKSLDELNEIGPIFTRMLELWKNGDADGLWKIVDDGFKNFPDVYREWIVNRNQAWLDAIDQLVRDDKNALLVVGAAHLVGPDGVPELLRARGYEVNQEFQPELTP